MSLTFQVTGDSAGLFEDPISPLPPVRARNVQLKEDIFPQSMDWVSLFQQYIEFFTRDGFFAAAPTIGDRRDGTKWPFFRSETELLLLRSASRLLMTTNPACAGLYGGICAYVIATGMKPKLTEKPHYDPSDAAQRKAKDYIRAGTAVLEEFETRDRFRIRQMVAFIRSCRDGDAFLRLFPTAGGYVSTRFVWPELVKQPPGTSMRHFGFGVKTGEESDNWETYDDIEDPKAFAVFGPYLTNWDEVPAHEMVWLPNGFTPGRWDLGERRGLPDPTFGVREMLDTAYKLSRNFGVGMSVRGSYAYIRQWATARQNDVQGYATGQANTFLDRSGFPPNQSPMLTTVTRPGQVEDIPAGREFATLPMHPETGEVDGIASLLLRFSARAWNAPEWLSTGSGQNGGAYTSEIVHESPWVRSVEAAQEFCRPRFDHAYKFVLNHAIDSGRLPTDFFECVKQEVIPQSPVTRNKEQETDNNLKLFAQHLKSAQQIMAEDDRDPEQTLREFGQWAQLEKDHGITDLPTGETKVQPVPVSQQGLQGEERGQSSPEGQGAGLPTKEVQTTESEDDDWQKIDEVLWNQCKMATTLPRAAGGLKSPMFLGNVDGNTTFLVDGDEIKLRPDLPEDKEHPHMNFVEAANDLEAAWVRREFGVHTILIDANLAIHDAAFNCYHEAVERRDMAKGMLYDPAHDRADFVEDKLRLMWKAQSLPNMFEEIETGNFAAVNTQAGDPHPNPDVEKMNGHSN